MRSEGGGFAANIYEAMPESRIQVTSYQSLCAPNPQLPVTSHSSLLSNFLRIPFSVSSSRAQPSIFLALRSGSHKHCTETTPWCYVFLLLHILRLSVCKEDFSLRSK